MTSTERPCKCVYCADLGATELCRGYAQSDPSQVGIFQSEATENETQIAQQDSQQGAGEGLRRAEPGWLARSLEEAKSEVTSADLWRSHPSGHTGGPVAWRGEAIPFECPYPSLGRSEAPYAYNIDPGAGSAMDRLQRDWPSRDQVNDLRKRDGRVTPLWPAAQQDGGSGWGEAVPSWKRKALAAIIDPQAFRNEDGHLIELLAAPDAYAKLDAILSALQSAHPASGAEDVGEALGKAAELLQEMVAGNSSRLTIEHERRARDLLARFTPQDGAVAAPSQQEGGR